MKDKEAKAQVIELKLTLLPELLPEKIQNLNMRMPEDNDNLLLKALTSKYSGQELLRLIEGRVGKVEKHGQPLTLSNGTKTQLGALKAQLEDLNLKLNKFVEDVQTEQPVDLSFFYEIAAMNFIAGYQAGAHDMKVNTERHANSGYEARIETPKKGGKGKSQKSAQMKKVILAIAKESIIFSLPKYISKVTLSEAINHHFINIYSNIDQSILESLGPYKSSPPKHKTIYNWLSELDSKYPENNPPKVSLATLEKQLLKKFSSDVINKLLAK
ncbi:hypothetical protein L4C33_15015 [Vibrio makurazakiensis]|uniref:hypothetical protein n=1 Tax=Vibrio makurazakiensis TaxID=2910250 RepID=UPI003D0FFE56